MKCQNCQTENVEDALFCENCGQPLQITVTPTVVESDERLTATTSATVIGAAKPVNKIAEAYPHSESMADFARYQRKLNDKAEQVKSAKEAVFWAESELEELKKSRRNCIIAGIVLMVLIGPLLIESSADSSVNIISSIFASVFLLANMFFIPFGFVPIKNFVNNHGFFFIFSWMFLLAAAMCLVVLALFIGLPYAIWLNKKITKAENEAEAITQHAQRLQAEYQTM